MNTTSHLAHEDRMGGRLRSFALMTLTAIVSAALFWLLRDHWRHALGLAPYLLFLACPLMHLFMHHGHGRGGRTIERAGQPPDR